MSVKYTHDNTCRWCTRLRANDLSNMKMGSKLVYTDPDNGKHYANEAGAEPREIPETDYQYMCELIDISRSDTDLYRITGEPCKVKAHYGLKYKGKCYECRQERLKPSPRQQAIINGDTWYTPLTPCSRCDEISERNVHNGSCRNCMSLTSTKQDSPDAMLMRDCPDMVVSKDEARDMGFKVYRTGSTCKRGHTGWRYISTGNCIDCIKGGE